MDLSSPMPRVNGREMMGSFVGKRVLLVCKVAGTSAGSVDAIAADGSRIRVTCRNAVDFQQDSFVEFEGHAESPDHLTEHEHVTFGEKFEMNNYNELCKLASGEFREVFLPN